VAVYIALLRGINVGGHNKLPMADLRSIAADSGLTDVATYIQSGNVVGVSRQSASRVGTDLHDAILAASGLDVRVVVRSATDLDTIVGENPFLERAIEDKQLHVVFLFARGSAKQIKGVDAADYAPDEVALRGSDAYLFTPNGLGRSKIATESMMRRLGIQGTARNWRTVTKLAAMATELG
jgi:uncharacterized protein (DUF1697 family)